jgi:hypothetical protein
VDVNVEVVDQGGGGFPGADAGEILDEMIDPGGHVGFDFLEGGGWILHGGCFKFQLSNFNFQVGTE